MHLRRIRRRSSIGLVAAVATAAVGAGLLAGCSSSRPEKRAAPSAAELTTAVDTFVDQNLGVGIRNRRAILVSVGGDTLVERYYDSSASETAAVASVTKSVVSILVGIAVSEGYLRIGQPLRDLLPAYRDLMSSQVAGISVQELLTMTAGLAPDADPDPRPSSDDWVADIVRRGTVQPPGQGFAYSSASSHLLAAILVEATDRPLLAYAREKLFDPLGIDTRPAFQPVLAAGRPEPERAYQRAGFAWPRDPHGIHVGYGYLKMSARDMVKIGNLFLDGGVWNGEQLVPHRWVEASTSPAVADTGGFGGGAHYGYQWWVISAGSHPAFAAVGYGGQIIEVVPDLRLVVVASTWIDEASSFDSRTWELMVTSAIVPSFEPDQT